jgi:hypothetical protein
MLTYFQSAFDVSVRAPRSDAATGEAANSVHALRIETVLDLIGDLVLERQRATDGLVRRRLEHAAFRIGSRVDAEDVAAPLSKKPMAAWGRYFWSWKTLPNQRW